MTCKRNSLDKRRIVIQAELQLELRELSTGNETENAEATFVSPITSHRQYQIEKNGEYIHHINGIARYPFRFRVGQLVAFKVFFNYPVTPTIIAEGYGRISGYDVAPDYEREYWWEVDLLIDTIKIPEDDEG